MIHKIETCGTSADLIDTLKEISGKNSINIPEDGIVKFSGAVDVKLDFNTNTALYFVKV